MASLGSLFFSLRGIGLLIVRLVVGGSMAFAHGYGKILDLSNFIGKVGELGYPFPVVFGVAAALSEFVGGVLFGVGLFTRFVSFFLFTTMANAAFYVHRADPFQKQEFALLYGMVFLAFLFIGPGRFSLDTVFRKVPTV